MRRLVALILLTSLLTSGCLGIGLTDAQPVANKPGPIVDPIAPAMLKVRDLLTNTTCEPSPTAAGTTSKNLKTLGQYKAPTGAIQIGTPAAMYWQMDTYRNRTVVSSPGGTSFSLLNTTDPTKPVQWSTGSVSPLAGGSILDPKWLTPYTSMYDVQFNEDGTNVIAGVNNRIYAYDATRRGFAYANYQGGWMDLPAEFGGHAYRLAVEQIGKGQYIFVAPGPTGTGMAVMLIAGSGPYAKIDSVGVMAFAGGQAGRITIQPFDIQLDTEFINDGNHTLLYAANGQHGVMVLDVNQPTKPDLITNIPAATPAPNSAPAVYTSVAVGHVDGKRILAASQNGPVAVLRVWDLTDFKTPKLLGTWTQDAGKASQPQGELNFVNSTLFLSHYDQGLWGFDVSALLNKTSGGLKPILHYQPPAGGNLHDVSIEDGIIQVTDPTTQTLQLLGYGCFVPGDRRYTSVG